MQFQRHQERIDSSLPRNEFESGIQSLKEMLDSKMNSAFTEFQGQINKISSKTEKRLD